MAVYIDINSTSLYVSSQCIYISRIEDLLVEDIQEEQKQSQVHKLPPAL